MELRNLENSIRQAATHAFDLIDGVLHSDQSGKKRTGICVLAREPGTRNMIHIIVYEPSDAARFFVCEKAVRAEVLGHPTSQQSSSPDIMRYAGCLQYQGIQVSVSGMDSEEDVAVAVFVLAMLFDVTMGTICRAVEKVGGEIPLSFNDPSHYLHRFISD